MPKPVQNQPAVRESGYPSVTHIYALQDIATRAVFYIGKANNPTKRLTQKYHPDVRARLKSTLCTQVILEEIHAKNGTICTGDWLPREEFWIQHYKRTGALLLNKNNGGGGVSYHTPEARAKSVRPLYGRPATEKIREAARQMGLRQRGRKHTAEEIDKQRRAVTGKPKPPRTEAHIEHLCLAQRKRWTVEARKKRSKSQKEAWQDPSYREHMSEVHKGSRGPYGPRKAAVC